MPEHDYSCLETMWAATPDALIAIDEHFHVFDINSAGCATLDCSLEDAIGHDCMQVLKCCNLNRLLLCGTSSCPLKRVLQSGTPLLPLPNEELIIGDAREVSASVTPLQLESELGVVFTARDMSTLKVANQVRSNFVSMVSHELRTPLNSVHGFVELLLQGHMGRLNDEQQTYLGYVQEGVQDLVSIVEDILLLTRSDVGQLKMKPQQVYLRELAKRVVSSLELQAHKAEVELAKDIPSPSPSLYVDPDRMKQVLNNLVTNAIKFTPPGGTVTIRARPHDKQHMMISVIDTGYGIHIEDRQHVFERFFQSNHSLQSKMGGYGLGLHIAKLIVEQHGGTIDFITGINEGTTFYFTAPLYTGKL